MFLPNQVTVIIPCYQDQSQLDAAIAAVMACEPAEILIGDDGSSPPLRLPPGARDTRIIRLPTRSGSYAARNACICEARSPVLAFTDADCLPDPHWIRHGAAALDEADLAGGRVRFNLSSPASASQRIDAQMNMRNDLSIPERGVAKTANLFVRKSLFDEIGLFDLVQSGGDVAWTARATRAGYSMVYVADAIVSHPARGFLEMLNKSWRVGRGMPRARAAEGQAPATLWRQALRALIPPSPAYLRRQMAAMQLPGVAAFLRLAAATWSFRLVTAAAIAWSLLRNRGG